MPVKLTYKLRGSDGTTTSHEEMFTKDTSVESIRVAAGHDGGGTFIGKGKVFRLAHSVTWSLEADASPVAETGDPELGTLLVDRDDLDVITHALATVSGLSGKLDETKRALERKVERLKDTVKRKREKE